MSGLVCRWIITGLCCAAVALNKEASLSLFFLLFSAGFAQGHDTFLRGFGSCSLIIPSIIQWLAGRWSEAMNKANLWAYELWQYKHTISTHFLGLSLKMHLENGPLQAEVGDYTQPHYLQIQTTKLGGGQTALNPSQALVGVSCFSGQLWRSFFLFLQRSFVKSGQFVFLVAHH